jgi:hypothetical protein
MKPVTKSGGESPQGLSASERAEGEEGEAIPSPYGTYPTGYDANSESNDKALKDSEDSGAAGIVSTPGTLVVEEEPPEVPEVPPEGEARKGEKTSKR